MPLIHWRSPGGLLSFFHSIAVPAEPSWAAISLKNGLENMQTTLLQLLASAVQKNRQREAVVHRGNRITYGELWNDINAISAFFAASGMSPGERVALLLPNSVEYLVAFYGTLAADGIVVPLDESEQTDNLSAWVAHAEADWLVLDARHERAAELAAHCGEKTQILWVGEPGRDIPFPGYRWDDAVGGVAVDGDYGTRTTGDRKAVILYHSAGSRPRGTVFSHRALMAASRITGNTLELREQDRIVNSLPFHHAAGIAVMNACLIAGAKLVLVNSVACPQAALTLMEVEKVTGFIACPWTFGVLLKRSRPGNYDLSALRFMASFGGPMRVTRMSELMRQVPHVRLLVAHGHAEVAGHLAVLPSGQLRQRPAAAGVPPDGIEVAIMGSQGDLLEPGQQGEIVARGETVSAGLWRDARGSRRMFRMGWLATGDKGYMDEGGYLYVTGRNPNVIKCGGHRVHPMDIEEVVRELPFVHEVAVVGVPDETFGQSIKCVVVVDDGTSDAEARVRQHCRQRLPAYKVPRTIEFVRLLPRAADGEIRRRSLAYAVQPAVSQQPLDSRRERRQLA